MGAEGSKQNMQSMRWLDPKHFKNLNRPEHYRKKHKILHLKAPILKIRPSPASTTKIQP